MKKILVLIAVFAATFLNAQSTGSVVGKLTDKEFNNEPLAFANVLIKGTTKGTTTDFDGHYILESLSPGAYTLIFSFVGYETQEVNVQVVAGKVTEVNIPMGASAASLDEIVITTVTKRESETALLLEKKKSVELKTTIGAQELSRKGVGDVAAAVIKASGVSKQEGGTGTIFVRGLGDRYNFSTLNGLPLPSNNPSLKNISLDLFSTDIVEFVDISKTYSAHQYGDYSGANVNINSKEHGGSPELEIKLGSGFNSNAFDQTNFKRQDGTSLLGFTNEKIPSNVLSGYNYTTSLNPDDVSSPIDLNFSIKGGKKFELGDEKSLKVFATLAFDNGYSYKEGVSRGGVTTQGLAKKDLFLKSYGYNTNTTGMTNLSFKANSNNNFYYNFLFVNSTGQNLEDFTGLIDVFDATGENFVRRATFERTTLFVNQLLGKHNLNETLDFNWGVAYNKVNNIIPDRQQTTLFDPAANEQDQGQRLITSSSLSTADSHRYYQELIEDELAGNLSLDLKFSKNDDEEYRGKVSLGYNGRLKNVDFQATQINTNITNEIDVDPNDLDAYFNSQRYQAEDFSLLTFRSGQANPLLPQLYTGEQFINAIYSTLNYKLSPKLQMILGVRGEAIIQNIDYDTSIDIGKNGLEELQILPSLALKYEVSEKSNLKFAASKTYTLPQFKERAPFQYIEVTEIKIGNPDLKPSTDYNFDLGFEYFPQKSAVISLTAFGKFIQDPINEFVKASATNDISYANTGDLATVLGLEFELKLDLLEMINDESDDEKLSFGLNASFMQTNQDLDEEKVKNENTGINVNFTNEEERLSGASDWLANADVTYFKKFKENFDIQATVTYNYASDRVYALGTNTRGNLIDSSINSLDFIFKSKISKNLGLGLSIRNILNPTIERTQETQNVIVSSYKKGLNSSLSLSYKF